MTLLVEAPAAYEPERRYVLDVVLGDRLGLDWTLRVADRRDVRISRADDPDGPCVRLPDGLFATPTEDWLTPASMPSVRVRDGLPVLYGEPAATPDPATLDVDVFGSAFFMLTRYEELVVADRDQYGRFPAAASVAGREGFLGVPVVDAWVELLWTALQRTWPRLRRRPEAFAVLLSHDVDDPLSTVEHGPRDVARNFAGDLVRRRDPRLAARRARALALRDRRSDPHNTFDFLMGASERHGLRSAFYFLAYRDERPARRRVPLRAPVGAHARSGSIARRGHEVGLHPSFCTYRDVARTREEHERLLRVAEAEGVRQQEWGGRQHYLRWANPAHVAELGAGRAGLRQHPRLRRGGRLPHRHLPPFRVFDLEQRRPLDLRETPFQVMDVTLLSSIGADPRRCPRRRDGHRRSVPAVPRMPRRPLAQQHAAALGS